MTDEFINHGKGSFHIPPGKLEFHAGGGMYMEITADRRLVLADDVTPSDAAKEFVSWVNVYLGRR